MARQKPPEDTDAIMLRPPISVGKKIRDLAERSNDGLGMPASKYCLAILMEAVRKEIVINEVVSYHFSEELDRPSLKVAEDEPKVDAPRKRKA